MGPLSCTFPLLSFKLFSLYSVGIFRVSHSRPVQLVTSGIRAGFLIVLSHDSSRPIPIPLSSRRILVSRPTPIVLPSRASSVDRHIFLSTTRPPSTISNRSIRPMLGWTNAQHSLLQIKYSSVAEFVASHSATFALNEIHPANLPPGLPADRPIDQTEFPIS